MTEMQKIRHFGRISGECNESVWDGLTRAECFRVFDAWMACGWDFYPDQWTAEQLTAAIRYGIVPAWRNDESPITYEATDEEICELKDEAHHHRGSDGVVDRG